MDLFGHLEQKGVALSEEQREAVAASRGCVLLLAVPGAGKTTVLVSRIANLILNCGADPSRILTLTFGRESVKDLSRRWAQLFGELLAPPAFSTIHSFCLSVLRDYAAGRGTQVPRLLEEGERARMLAQIDRSLTGSYPAEDRMAALDAAVGYAANLRLDAAGIEALGRKVDGLPEVLSAFTQAKREGGAMDFDDILTFCASALSRRPELLRRWSQRYDFLCVDEAQDTSRVQHDILRLLTRDNLFMVGDEDQSIYGFRGAWPQGMTEFFSAYPGGRLLKLETNYRSTPQIVAAASEVISHGARRFPKAMVAVRGQGEPVLLTDKISLEDEYDYILEKAAATPPGKTCAVLYRSGFSAVGLAAAFRAAGAEFFCRGGGVGYRSDAVTREIVSLMKLAADPGDAAAFSRCYYRLGCAIPRETARAAMEAAPEDLLGWVLEEADYASKNSGKLMWTRRVLQKMSRARPAQQFELILREIDYLANLEKRGQGGYTSNANLLKLCVLRRLASDAADLPDFLSVVEGAEESCRSPEKSAVTLSTVHSAKGQEFDRVILADALDGVFPDSSAVEDRAAGDADPMEEELRLFYTAMTRARDRLEILCPSEGMGRKLHRSRFAAMLDPAGVLLAGETVGPGACVAHASFGIGEITAVDARRGSFTVRFRIYGEKTFAAESLADGRIFRVL